MQMQIVTDRDREEERKKFLSDLIGNNGVDNWQRTKSSTFCCYVKCNKALCHVNKERWGAQVHFLRGNSRLGREQNADVHFAQIRTGMWCWLLACRRGTHMEEQGESILLNPRRQYSSLPRKRGELTQLPRTGAVKGLYRGSMFTLRQ